jgi:hypothetical protein
MSRKIKHAESAPHSWHLEHWPTSVYPHTAGRARYVLRAHRAELMACGALSRVGREIVVLGERYCRWLERHTADVAGFMPAMHLDTPQSGVVP